MEAIQITGMNLLTEVEKKLADKLINEYYEKIQRGLHNELSLQVHFKEHKPLGEKRKYSVHVKAIAPTKTLAASASDWDFARTMHKVCKDIERQIEHQKFPKSAADQSS